MKTPAITVVTALLSVCFSRASFSQLLNENFEYPVGQLTGLNAGADVSGGNWISFSGTGNPVQVVTGSLTYASYPSSGLGNRIQIVATSASAEDTFRAFPAQTEGTTTYLSLLISVNDTLGLTSPTNGTGDYFVTLLPPGSASTFVARISIRKGTTPNTYQLGIRANNSNTTTAWNAMNIPAGTAQLVVAGYEIVTGAQNDTAMLWINPPLGNTRPTPDVFQVTAGTSDITEVGRIAVRQGTGGTPNAFIDGIRVASSWFDAPLPVQLIAFSAVHLPTGQTQLRWSTASETSNYGFEIQRSSFRNEGYASVSELIPGHGTTNLPQDYSYVDTSAGTGRFYRLKQINLDRSVYLSEPVEVALSTVMFRGTPRHFGLLPNYPNPFNPGTAITYHLSRGGRTTLIVYDILGRVVASLVDTSQEEGTHTVQWDASAVPSGIFIARLRSGEETDACKLVVLK